MNNDLAIRAEDISKKYQIGKQHEGSLRGMLGNLFSNKSSDTEDFWALKHINFEIRKGEAIGIIGKNGAGKSTLLKILSSITKPTSGHIELNGRVSSLLEVGTGFHHELTGRENIFLNGTILGMSRSEVKSKFDEIVDFSGVEKFIDTPVKHYSSGMYVRLAFAVAAYLEPEILIVDEVLAVGDAEFQKKCLGKMEEVSKNQGRTVLFVSHNMAAVKSLCTKGILISKGTSSSIDKIDTVINQYISGFQSGYEVKKKWTINQPKGENITLIEAEILTKNNFSISDEILISFSFDVEVDMKQFNASLVLYTVDNHPIFNTWSQVEYLKMGTHNLVLKIPSHFLNNIIYRVRILFVNQSKAIFDLHDVLYFEATEENRDINWYGEVVGVVRPKFEWVMKKNI